MSASKYVAVITIFFLIAIYFILRENSDEAQIETMFNSPLRESPAMLSL